MLAHVATAALQSTKNLTRNLGCAYVFRRGRSFCLRVCGCAPSAARRPGIQAVARSPDACRRMYARQKGLSICANSRRLATGGQGADVGRGPRCAAVGIGVPPGDKSVDSLWIERGQACLKLWTSRWTNQGQARDKAGTSRGQAGQRAWIRRWKSRWTSWGQARDKRWTSRVRRWTSGGRSRMARARAGSRRDAGMGGKREAWKVWKAWKAGAGGSPIRSSRAACRGTMSLGGPSEPPSPSQTPIARAAVSSSWFSTRCSSAVSPPPCCALMSLASWRITSRRRCSASPCGGG